MNKRILSILMVILLVICTAGCGNESNTPKKTQKNTKSSDNQNTTSDKPSDENPSAASVATKTITVEIPRDESGLYLEQYERENDDNEKTIPLEFTLSGDKSSKKELKLGKYQYVWGDEFNGNALDTSIWSDYDSATRGSDQKITMDAITVSGGILKCIAKRYYDPLNSSKKWITAPSISTNYSMVFQHGYLEMRAKLPYKQGAWPSFWLTSRSNSSSFRDDFPNREYSVELDVFEIINSVDTMTTTLHKWFVDGSHTILSTEGYTFIDTTNLCDEYHIYAFEWTSDKITLYLDGVKWYEYDLKEIYKNDNDDTHGFDQYMKIILGVGTLLSPNFKSDSPIVHLDQGDEMSDMPFEYCIDWIRLYQEPGKTAIQYLS